MCSFFSLHPQNPPLSVFSWPKDNRRHQIWLAKLDSLTKWSNHWSCQWLDLVHILFFTGVPYYERRPAKISGAYHWTFVQITKSSCKRISHTHPAWASRWAAFRNYWLIRQLSPLLLTSEKFLNFTFWFFFCPLAVETTETEGEWSLPCLCSRLLIKLHLC